MTTAAEYQHDIEKLAGENVQLRGVIGVLASRVSDNFFGVFDARQIEDGLAEASVTHGADGSVTVTPNNEDMGS